MCKKRNAEYGRTDMKSMDGIAMVESEWGDIEHTQKLI